MVIPHALINPGWRLLKEYKVAGSYTWTAPDLFGGKSYWIGVAIIGGGGGGGAGLVWQTDTSGTYTVANGAASGGGSGFADYFILEVTPGKTYTVIVGAGGISCTASVNITSSSGSGGDRKNGGNGGSSAFNGRSVNGGTCGNAGYLTSTYYSSLSVSATAGGQPGSASTSIEATSNPQPYGGRTPFGNPIVYPYMSINPFTLEPCLIAGAGIYMVGGTVRGFEQRVTLSCGNGSSTGGNINASKGTAPGCGGSGAVWSYRATSVPTGTRSITSAPGCDGAVMIYIQGGVAA